MQQLIQEHPALVQLAFIGLVGVVVYLYKQNESNSAKLIATKLDQIHESLKILWQHDQTKTDALAELSERQIAQEQRCDDREKSCPGKFARKDLARHQEKD